MVRCAVVICVMWCGGAWSIEVPDQPLAGLRAGHPRLILTPELVERLRATLAEDELAAKWYAALRTKAERISGEPVTPFNIVGPTMLPMSRQVLDRIFTLGLIYQVEGDEALGRRAVAELQAAADWPHWNPDTYLDCAELIQAFAIGCDWLRPLLGDDRERIERALIEKGLHAALKRYEADIWWARCSHNWNQVCNGANITGALAVAELEPELAERIIRHAVPKLPLAMVHYGPDGGWGEGPGYWHYATRYTAYLLAALETALGHDFGLSEVEGLAVTGDFRLHFIGPSRRPFNYADAHSGLESAEEMFWLARRYDRPSYAWHQRHHGGRHALDLVWYLADGQSPGASGEPLDRWFRGVEVGFLRGAWDDPRASWVAFKGGSNRVNHAHLDLGTFVVDALGERWLVELGPDSYRLPGYFGKQRWDYYRLATRGQNCLLIDGANQDPRAAAPGLGFWSTPAFAGGVVDLSAAYPVAERVWRGFAMLDRRDILVVDEVEVGQPVSLDWGAHTAAQVAIDGHRATLQRGGQTFYLQVLEPVGATLVVAPTGTVAPENLNDGILRLSVRYDAPAGSTRLAVLMTPDPDAAPPHLDLDLRGWLERSTP